MAALALDALRATAPDAIAGPLTFVVGDRGGVHRQRHARRGEGGRARRRRDPPRADRPRAPARRRRDRCGSTSTSPGKSAHAERADRAVNPVDLALPVVDALRDLEREMNADIEPSIDGVAHPYNINIGTFAAGDWPSSVPALATLGVRVGHPDGVDARRGRGPGPPRRSTRSAKPWLRDHPPADPAVRVPGQGVRAARRRSARRARWRRRTSAAHGDRPRAIAMASTTDARLYLNDFDVPGALLRTAGARHPRDRRVGRAVVDRRRARARWRGSSPTGTPGARPSMSAVADPVDPGAGQAPQRRRARRRPAGHGDRARRVRARPAPARPSASSRRRWGSAARRSARRSSGSPRSGTSRSAVAAPAAPSS